MNSKIFTGKLFHKRIEPVSHEFTYPVYFFAFDIDELQALDKQIPIFGYNKKNVFSLFDQDYLHLNDLSLRSKVENILKEREISENPHQIFLVTNARFFGHVFNPVSFFYCYQKNGDLLCIVAQVNNTYGESHLYFLDDFEMKKGRFEMISKRAKEFHVSPFFDRTGAYEFKMTHVREKMEIQVNLLNEQGAYCLISSWGGESQPMTKKNLLKVILCYPMSVLLTLPRIHVQAFKLYFFKKIKHHSKPNPDHKMTIRQEQPNLFRKKCMKVIFGIFSKIQIGQLDLVLPEGVVKSFGSDNGVRAEIHVKHYRFFSRLVLDSGIGLGEGYMVEDWDSHDPAAVLNLLIQNKSFLESRSSLISGLGNFIHNLRHRGRANTISGSKRNIQEHYDLSNDFFKLFLDESMTYSSGLFLEADDTLAQAQDQKLQLILEKARIHRHHHVLEIGCGWGSFAIKAVKATGCKMTCLTLSSEQLKLAKERVAAEGLSEQIDIRLCDYRHIEGSYDRIVSIEMLEAVGHQQLPEFFKTCDKLLKKDGLIVIQTITIPDQRYKSYLKGCDFIQKHIFPGGHLPSVEFLSQVLSRHTQLFIEDLENIGYDYAKTLCLWKENFLREEENVSKLGFDRLFRRKWEYYLAYCEAGFRNRYLNDLHLVLTRVGNKNLNQRVQFNIAPNEKMGTPS